MERADVLLDELDDHLKLIGSTIPLTVEEFFLYLELVGAMLSFRAAIEERGQKCLKA